MSIYINAAKALNMHDYQHDEMNQQIMQCLALLEDIFQQELLGVYLFGSWLVGGLQKYSDLDIFVVAARPTSHEQKSQLVTNLLRISGIYQRSSKPPIEMTIVVKADINPWRYPPKFDFQYGDWLRAAFESGNMEPWSTKVMPDLAVIITQVLLASETLFGPSPDQLLCHVPYKDFLAATKDAVNHLLSDLHNDTRNVLLTYARIWKTIATDTMGSKQAAAVWVSDKLPDIYKPVMQRAHAICIGNQKDNWDDLAAFIQPTAAYMIEQINKAISLIELSNQQSRLIRLTES